MLEKILKDLNADCHVIPCNGTKVTLVEVTKGDGGEQESVPWSIPVFD